MVPVPAFIELFGGFFYELVQDVYKRQLQTGPGLHDPSGWDAESNVLGAFNLSLIHI